MSIPISESIIKSFKPSKTFRYHENNAPITSLDFDDSGQFLISSGIDESMQLYDASKGKHLKSVLSKKYGVHLARFTHHDKSIIYASTKGNDNTIRYLSLHDNSFIRYFRAHKLQVLGLEMSPLEDVFLSTALDDSVRLWDLRSNTCQGYMACKSPSLIAFDPSGVVFAVASNVTKEVGLYDVKNFEKEPFAVFSNAEFTNGDHMWSKIEFSNDGKHLVITSTSLGSSHLDHYVLDAFEGTLKGKLTGATRFSPRKFPDTGSTTISPDGRFVYGGAYFFYCFL